MSVCDGICAGYPCLCEMVSVRDILMSVCDGICAGYLYVCVSWFILCGISLRLCVMVQCVRNIRMSV